MLWVQKGSDEECRLGGLKHGRQRVGASLSTKKFALKSETLLVKNQGSGILKIDGWIFCKSCLQSMLSPVLRLIDPGLNAVTVPSLWSVLQEFWMHPSIEWTLLKIMLNKSIGTCLMQTELLHSTCCFSSNVLCVIWQSWKEWKWAMSCPCLPWKRSHPGSNCTACQFWERYAQNYSWSDIGTKDCVCALMLTWCLGSLGAWVILIHLLNVLPQTVQYHAGERTTQGTKLKWHQTAPLQVVRRDVGEEFWCVDIISNH